VSDRCGECTRCRLAAEDERYARFDCQATGRGGVRVQAVPLPTCRHEGPVVDPAACGCADKDVRWCLWDGAGWDHCTRRVSRDPNVRQCSADCPGYSKSGSIC
jgi:hypothetical protein